MKAIIFKIKAVIILKKELKKQIKVLTNSLPCVNLSMKYSMLKGFMFYNNSDFIGSFTYEEMMCIAFWGKSYFNLLIYCLCIKNSIDNY
ncbi:MAG: hypothetical protein PUE08_00340 [Eubacteriales bacterium]|nr:hypothetical protein [Eubacteriales bacterium]